MNTVTIIVCIILPVYLPVRPVHKRYADSNMKHLLKKYSFQPRLGCLYYFSHLYKSN